MGYRQEREINERFVSSVRSWIEARGEVFIVLRYLHGAGSKDYLFCRTPEEFLQLTDRLPRGTEVIVFRDPQLTLRGVVSDSFLQQVLAFIPNGAEYLIALSGASGRPCSFEGDSHAELIEDLRGIEGREVALGLMPQFIQADHEGMISAAKGGIDGPR